MNSDMSFFKISLLSLFLNFVISASTISKNPLIINKFNFGEIRDPKMVHAMREREIFAFVRQLEKENQKRLKQEKEIKIYRENLASRVKSSIIKDFLTTRYLNNIF
jgi:hypothetical protein